METKRENGPKRILTPTEIRARMGQIEDEYLAAPGAQRARLNIEYMQLKENLEAATSGRGGADVAEQSQAAHR